MTTRAAVLIDDNDRKVGKTMVRETTFIVRHRDVFYVRTNEGIRLTRGGVGVGVVFRATDVFVREKLEPIP